VRQCATASAPRQRLRQRSSTEAIIGGVTGTIGRPETLLLGRYDADGVLRYINPRLLRRMRAQKTSRWWRRDRPGLQSDSEKAR